MPNQTSNKNRITARTVRTIFSVRLIPSLVSSSESAFSSSEFSSEISSSSVSSSDSSVSAVSSSVTSSATSSSVSSEVSSTTSATSSDVFSSSTICSSAAPVKTTAPFSFSSVSTSELFFTQFSLLVICKHSFIIFILGIYNVTNCFFDFQENINYWDFFIFGLNFNDSTDVITLLSLVYHIKYRNQGHIKRRVCGS